MAAFLRCFGRRASSGPNGNSRTGNAWIYTYMPRRPELGGRFVPR